MNTSDFSNDRKHTLKRIAWREVCLSKPEYFSQEIVFVFCEVNVNVTLEYKVIFRRAK